MNQELLKYCLEKGFLIDKEMMSLLENVETALAQKLLARINSICHERLITKACLAKNHQRILEVIEGLESGNKKVVEKLFIKLGINIEVTKETIEEEKEEKEKVYTPDFKILESYPEKSKKMEVSDFSKHFRNRFNSIKKILMERQELQNLISINKIGNNKQGISLIGIVYDKRITKNKNILLEIEDSTGRIAALINHNKPEIYEKAKDIFLDEIIGLKCSGNREIVFVNEVIFPDIYLQEKKRNKEEVYAAFTSDLHIGSGNFLGENFQKFINWLNGKYGGKEWKKVRYLFIVGDSVDGVGIFPGQEELINIKDIKDQYKKLNSYLSQIRKDVKIIMCPGQHDASRVAEPQPMISKEFAEPLYNIENLYLVSNPAMVSIGDAEIKVLMYHGASMHSFINEIESLRLNRGHDTPAKVVKEMLKRRHLAPTHSSVIYVPNEEKDPLVIDEIPDIITTGEVHRVDIDTYNNVLIICNSCWQSKTPFEEKVGNNPLPGKVPILNLKTREMKIIDFSEGIGEEAAKRAAEKRKKMNQRDEPGKKKTLEIKK